MNTKFFPISSYMPIQIAWQQIIIVKA